MVSNTPMNEKTLYSVYSDTRRSVQKPLPSTEATSKRPISRCLHVGNVGVKASEEDLCEEFGQFGEIEDVKIVHQGGTQGLF